MNNDVTKNASDFSKNIQLTDYDILVMKTIKKTIVAGNDVEVRDNEKDGTYKVIALSKKKVL